MSKLFDIAEANSLLPAFVRSFERIAALRAELESHIAELRAAGIDDVSLYLASPSKVPEPLRPRLDRVAKLASAVEGEIRTIHETGALVKDIDLGLVDFPGLLNGRPVNLCWRLGETEIRFWHDLDKGFRDRRPLLRVIGGSGGSDEITDPSSLN